ncbi:MAG: LLM class flavin-dependent oxidoreductase, partial [Variibacter sp.]|nr:LLM class flavin-dependent oxidoreductase [Variibacter sp.]
AGSPGSIKKVAERGFNLMLDQFASTATIVERFNLFKSEVEKSGRAFDPMSVGVCRAFYVSRTAQEKRQAIENRLTAQRRMSSLAQTPDGANKSSMMTFADTLEATEESALYGTPDEISEKLHKLRQHGIENILLNGPTGSREHLRRFAHDVIPAFSDLPPVRVPSEASVTSIQKASGHA